MPSVLSGTVRPDLPDDIVEAVEAVEADDLLEVERISENWSQ